MAYEKADFYAAYGVYAVDPVTRHRFANFSSPHILGGQKITCRLHYHPTAQKESMQNKAIALKDYFIAENAPLVPADSLIVVGGAFGWLGEMLENRIGLVACSIDPSNYVQAVKDQSADDELIESIEAAGYTHTDGDRGQFLFEKFGDLSPRSRNPERVLQEDLASPQSRNTVRQALTRKPTRMVTEEVWQILDEADKNVYRTAATTWGLSLTHIIDGVTIGEVL
jgi:hypothetical protein